MCLALCSDDDIVKEMLKYKPDLTIRNQDGKLVTEIKSEYEDLNALISEYTRN